VSGLDYSVRHGIARLTLNRPARRNALDRGLFARLTEVLLAIDGDPAIRATIVTGAGSAFCSGIDLDDFLEGGPIDTSGPTVLSIERTTPLIAAVNGPAVAAGFELVLACDLVLAAPEARFSLPEVRRGLVAAGGGVWRLVQVAGLRAALEVVVTAAELDAARAAELGVVNRVVPGERLLPEAEELAAQVALGAPTAVARSLELARLSFGTSERDLWAAARALAAEAMRSPEAVEGAAAWREHREPRWPT
jgi:enoyl-CoA hydratase/carnithine racemase